MQISLGFSLSKEWEWWGRSGRQKMWCGFLHPFASQHANLCFMPYKCNTNQKMFSPTSWVHKYIFVGFACMVKFYSLIFSVALNGLKKTLFLLIVTRSEELWSRLTQGVFEVQMVAHVSFLGCLCSGCGSLQRPQKSVWIGKVHSKWSC